MTFTCQAAGVPMPIITWRLNWGHIPVSARWVVTTALTETEPGGAGVSSPSAASVSSSNHWANQIFDFCPQ